MYATPQGCTLTRDEEGSNVIKVKRNGWRSITYSFTRPINDTSYAFTLHPNRETHIPDGCKTNDHQLVHLIDTCPSGDDHITEFHVLRIHGNDAINMVTITCQYRRNEWCEEDKSFMVVVEGDFLLQPIHSQFSYFYYSFQKCPPLLLLKL